MYELHALLANQSVLEKQRSAFESIHLVPLGQGVAMIPMTSALYVEITSGARDGPFPPSVFEHLSWPVARWAEGISGDGVVAYVEGEYFGGVGDQRCVIWKAGRMDGPTIGVNTINEVLRLLGVVRVGQEDEFDSVGLSRYRKTEQWAAPPATRHPPPAR